MHPNSGVGRINAKEQACQAGASYDTQKKKKMWVSYLPIKGIFWLYKPNC